MLSIILVKQFFTSIFLNSGAKSPHPMQSFLYGDILNVPVVTEIALTPGGFARQE